MIQHTRKHIEQMSALRFACTWQGELNKPSKTFGHQCPRGFCGGRWLIGSDASAVNAKRQLCDTLKFGEFPLPLPLSCQLSLLMLGIDSRNFTNSSYSVLCQIQNTDRIWSENWKESIQWLQHHHPPAATQRRRRRFPHEKSHQMPLELRAYWDRGKCRNICTVWAAYSGLSSRRRATHFLKEEKAEMQQKHKTQWNVLWNCFKIY